METRDQYVTRMLKLVNVPKVKESWVDFKKKFYKENGEVPEYWCDFMELDDADLTDLEIWASVDKNFHQRILTKPNIINKEVYDKIDRKTHGVIPDHMQIEVEGDTGSGKSTLMLAFCLENWPDFCSDDIFYLQRTMLDDIADNPEKSKFTIKVLDEDVKTYGVGSVRSENDLNQMIESCRKAGLSFCRCRAVAKHQNQTIYYRLLVFAKNVSRRITCAAVFRSNICIGFIQVRIPSTKNFFELEYDYNIKKDEFIEKTLRQDNKETINLDKMSEELLKHPQVINSPKFEKKVLKTIAYKLFNNLTNEERDFVVTNAWLLYHDKTGEVSSD